MPSPNRIRANRKRRPELETEQESPGQEFAPLPRPAVPIYATREPPPSIERIGDILRGRRQQRGDDMQQIADYLCIRKSFLIALEESDYDELPADAYVIGFLRSYAHYLGFDGADAINRYRGEMTGRRRKPMLILPTPISEGRTPSAAIMIGAAVAAILIYTAWYMFSAGDRTALNTPPTLPIPATATITENTIAIPAPAPAIGPTPSKVTAPAPAKVTAPPPTVAAIAAPSVDTPEAQPSHLVIRAEKESWVMVTDNTGKALIDHVMKAGETFAVPDVEGLKLTTGNSGGIALILDGMVQPKLSRNSSILHDVPLNYPKPN